MSGGKCGIILGQWSWVGRYFRGVGLGGALFWVSGGGWAIILDR